VGVDARAVVEQMAHDGDFAKRHLVNPVLMRMLGDLPGRRVLDAGCGNGYLSRMLPRSRCSRSGMSRIWQRAGRSKSVST
jgi:2-polyprenyl-3-methyl-5-hydroxy-6-metoxy-1,4-benzoquinol methylase